MPIVSQCCANCKNCSLSHIYLDLHYTGIGLTSQALSALFVNFNRPTPLPQQTINVLTGAEALPTNKCNKHDFIFLNNAYESVCDDYEEININPPESFRNIKE